MKLYLIDGYSFVFRAYYSLPPLTRADGLPSGAIYGFMNMMLNLLKEKEPEMISVVLDSGEKNFRHDIYPQYKANREAPPEDLVRQFPYVKEAVASMNIKMLERIGYEADDLIASYTKMAEASGHEVVIVSSDKDLMQLIGGSVSLYDTMKGVTVDTEYVENKFGIKPPQVKDYLSLIGDSSDNIPGVKGVGPKAAVALITEHDNLDAIYGQIDSIKPDRRRNLLQEGRENAYLSRRLIALKDDLLPEEGYGIEDLVYAGIDYPKLLHFLETFGFKALYQRYSKNMANSSGSTKGKQGEIRQEEIDLFASDNSGDFSMSDVDYTQIDENQELSNLKNHFPAIERNGIVSLHYGAKDSPYITISSGDLHWKVSRALESELYHTISAVLQSPSILKILIDVKNFMHVLHRNGIDGFSSYDDLAIMTYLCDSSVGDYSENGILKYLSSIGLLSIDCSMSAVNVSNESAITSNTLISMHRALKRRLYDHHNLSLYEDVEKPLIKRLWEMELFGIKIDTGVLKSLQVRYQEEIEKYTKDIYDLAGEEFNIGSTKQLSHILFEKLNIKGGKKTKTGNYVTDAAVLEKLASSGIIIADKVLKWRHYSKLVSTYTASLIESAASSVGSRIHTNFVMTGTNTGRLSSMKPNLQNIPVRTEEGRHIRKAFVASEGKLILSADYSQVELRILAHIADVKQLKEAFKNKQDIHMLTASQVFGTPVSSVSSVERYRAKAINFGIIYGQSAFGLAEQLSIPKGDAKEYIDTYFAIYPEIKQYMDDVISYARSHGYVKTIMGRRCVMNNINNANFHLRAFAERMAINAPIQGSNADFIKKAMVQLDDECSRFLMLQIHDELLFEIPETMMAQASNRITSVMENVFKLDVPLVVNVKQAPSWGV